MSAPAYLEGNAERPVGRDYDKGQASMENAVRSGPCAYLIAHDPTQVCADPFHNLI